MPAREWDALCALRHSLGALFLFVSGCLPVTRPVVKIALVAPFEGRYRDVGYEAVYAVRLAVREMNERGGLAGYSVELVALDDAGDPAMAVEQARKTLADPQVVAVVGHWLGPTSEAAAREYQAAGMPALLTAAIALPEPPGTLYRLWPAGEAIRAAVPGALHCPEPCGSLEDLGWLLAHADSREPIVGPPLWGQPQFVRLAGPAAEGVAFVAPAPLPAGSTDPAFAERYRAISNGVEPRFNAVLAYDAAGLIFAAINQATRAHGEPSRAAVAAAIPHLHYTGLSGSISFDTEHNWAEARGWVYRWHEGQVVPVND